MKHTPVYGNESLVVKLCVRYDISFDPSNIYYSELHLLGDCTVHSKVRSIPYNDNMNDAYILAEHSGGNKSIELKKLLRSMGRSVAKSTMYTDWEWNDETTVFSNKVTYEAGIVSDRRSKDVFYIGRECFEKSIMCYKLSDKDFHMQRCMLHGC